jgi:phosphopantetheinyl transferase
MKKILVHLLSLEEIQSHEETLLSYVDRERREKTLKYKRRLNQLQSLGSGYFLRKYTSMDKKMKYTEYGKPYKDGEFFNIAHSADYVVFLQTDADCGIDLEKIRPIKDRLFDYVLSVEDRKEFVTDEDFLQAWTRKEAIVKTLGGSIFSDIRKIPSHEGKVFLDDRELFVKTVRYQDYVISVSVCSKEEISLEISAEKISV